MCRELRKPLGERAHGGHVLALVCPSDGQVVWSTSSKTTLMWDAGKAGVGMELNGRGCLLRGGHCRGMPLQDLAKSPAAAPAVHAPTVLSGRVAAGLCQTPPTTTYW